MKLRLKKFFKWLVLGTLIVFVLGGILGLIFYKDVKGWMIAGVQQYLSEMEYGDLEITSMDIALFQDLPNITIRLGEVSFYEQKDSLRTTGQPPILFAQNIFLAIEPLVLLRHKRLKVTYVSIEEGVLNLLTYKDGQTNLERALSKPTQVKKKVKRRDSTAVKSPEPKQVEKKDAQKQKDAPGTQKFEIALKDIHLDNLLLKYSNPDKAYYSEVDVTSLDGEILLNESGISCDVETVFEITKSTRLASLATQGPASLELNLDYFDGTQTIVINEGDLSFERISMALKGSYDHKKGKSVNMQFDASSNDLDFLSKLIQEDILNQNRASINDTDIVLKGRIEGELEDNIPHIDVEFGVKNLSMVGPSGKIELKGVGFEGDFQTGEADDFSEATLALRNLRGETSGGALSGNFYVRNFQRPYLKSTLKVALDLEGYDGVFNLPNIDSLQGDIRITADFDGILNLEQEHQMDSIGSWSVELKDLGFYYLPFEKKISKLSGTLRESHNEVTVENLSMRYGSSDLNLNGRLKKLYHFIFNKEQDIEAEIELSSSQWFTSDFIVNPERSALIDDRLSNLRLEAKVTGRDNDVYDSYLPKFHVELRHLSMDLDELPGISNLKGALEFKESEEGYLIDLNDLSGMAQAGTLKLSGQALIPADFQTLDVNVHMDIDEVPLEYASDLIKEMNDKPLSGAKNLQKTQMTLINGKSDLSAIIELIPFGLSEARVVNTNVSLRQPDSALYEVNNLTLTVDGLHFMHEAGSNKIVGIKDAKGELHLDALITPTITKTPMDLMFAAANDQIGLEFSILRDMVEKDKGTLFLDISKSPPPFKLSYNLDDISLARVVEDYSTEQLMEGDINVSMEFSGAGGSLEEIQNVLEGHISISGDSLMLFGIDLDDLLRKYKRSQQFNLADISAYVIAGPFGAAVTKGADFTNLIAADLKPEHQTEISKALVHWSVGHGMLKTEDVAFSTRQNRVAMKGGLDFVRDTIPGLTVYVVDKKGCSLMQQRIYGKMTDIQMGELKLAKTLLGSVINLVESVVGKKCNVVYTGEVSHPDSMK